MGRHTWATSLKNILFSYGFGYAWIFQEIENNDNYMLEFVSRVSDVCNLRLLKNQNFVPTLILKLYWNQKNTFHWTVISNKFTLFHVFVVEP